MGLSYRPVRLHMLARPAGTTTLRHSQLYPPLRGYEFGHRQATGRYYRFGKVKKSAILNDHFLNFYLSYLSQKVCKLGKCCFLTNTL
jgi:hypothetical protein